MRSIGTSEYPIPSSSASLDSRHERQSNRLATRTRNSVVMARWDMYGSAGCLVARAVQRSQLTLHLDRASGPERAAAYLSCLLYTSPSPRDRQKSRMPSSA